MNITELSRSRFWGKVHRTTDGCWEWAGSICYQYATGSFRQSDLAEQHGIGRTTVADITQGKTWVTV